MNYCNHNSDAVNKFSSSADAHLKTGETPPSSSLFNPENRHPRFKGRFCSFRLFLIDCCQAL